MKKQLKYMVICMAAMIVLFGTANSAKEAGFKGNLNAAYKGSEGRKIKLKKTSAKKVNVTIITTGGLNQGTFHGKISSDNTVKFTLDGGEKISLKWKDKKHFTAKANQFSSETIQMARQLCYALNNVSYTLDAPKENSSYWLQGGSKAAGGNMRMYYKGNKIELKGKTSKAASRSKLNDASEKKKSYNLQVADDCKVFLVEFENTQTQTYKEWVKANKYKNGDEVSCIQAVFEIKDGKIRRIFFSA